MPLTRREVLDIRSQLTRQGSEYDVRYLVSVGSRLQGPAYIASQMGLFYGAPYQFTVNGVVGDQDNSSFLQSMTIDQVDQGNFLDYYVNASYRPPENAATGDGEANPLLQPLEINWSLATRQESVAVDLDGKVIQNTAGDLFEHERDNNLPVFTITRNQLFVNTALLLAIRNATNLLAWQGFGPRQAKVANITAQSKYTNLVPGGLYFECAYSFTTDESFRFRPWNAGVNQLVDEVVTDPKTGSNKTVKERRPIMVGSERTTTPEPLDTDGKSMLDKDGKLKATKVPYRLDFRDYPEIDMLTVLGF